MVQMTHKINIISMLVVFILISTSFSVIGEVYREESLNYKNMSSSENGIFKVSSIKSEDMPSAIIVTDKNPFYSIIATPLAVRYDGGTQTVIPLYIKDFENPSKAIERAEEQIGISVDFVITDEYTPREISLSIAETFWIETNSALLIKDNQEGYELGVVAAPISSYLGIPIIVTDNINLEVTTILDDLGVENLYICGDLYSTNYNITSFNSEKEIRDLCITIISDLFGESVGYITMTNPLDINQPNVLNRNFWYITISLIKSKNLY